MAILHNFNTKGKQLWKKFLLWNMFSSYKYFWLKRYILICRYNQNGQGLRLCIRFLYPFIPIASITQFQKKNKNKDARSKLFKSRTKGLFIVPTMIWRIFRCALKHFCTSHHVSIYCCTWKEHFYVDVCVKLKGIVNPRPRLLGHCIHRVTRFCISYWMFKNCLNICQKF